MFIQNKKWGRRKIDQSHIIIVMAKQHPFIDQPDQQKISIIPTEWKVNEYLLIIQPHEDLYNKMVEMKQSFAKQFDCPMAMYLKPHLTLLLFKQYEMMEQKIIHRLQNITMQQSSFSIELNGFGSFPSHTVYINVQTKNIIVDLVKELKQAQSLLKLNAEDKPHFITEPHISVAGKLLPRQYEKAWIDYQQKNFTARFIVNEIILLRRNEQHKAYQVIGKFPLLHQVRQVQQTSLFV